MANADSTLEFDFESYVASLMEAMEMDKAEPEVQQEVTLELGRQLGYRITTALSIHFSDKDWSILNRQGSEYDLSKLLSEAIEKNPEIKGKLLEELNEFYEETVNAHKQLSKNS